MTFTFLLFITRKPSLTPEEFKNHWESVHIPLLKEIAGDTFPTTHTRRYIARPVELNSSWPAAVLVGTQDDFTYDGVAELVFRDEEAFRKFFGVVSEPANKARIEEDEEAFIVREAMRAVGLGDTVVTS